MKISEIAEKMCSSELAAADIKAICNSRGFSLSDTRSPALFESLLLSDMGLQSAFASLNRKALIMLHFLKCWKKPVGIDMFDRLRAKRASRYDTFNQKYGDLFKQVKMQLVRKGILVFSTDPSRLDMKTKLERQVFGFPTPFHASLPPLFSKPAVLPGDGEFNAPFIRAKLNQLTQLLVTDDTDPFAWSLKNGVLMLGGAEFKTDTLRIWKRQAWGACCVPNLLTETHAKDGFYTPMAAMDYAFSTLGPDEWIEPEEMQPIFQVFCRQRQKLKAQPIFQHGWKKACLVRQKKDGKTCYRPAPPLNGRVDAANYQDFLSADGAGGIQVNLETIPLHGLEAISRISQFRITDGVLTASPDIVRMGRRFNEFREDCLTKWLAQSSDAFSDAFSTVSERWGQHLMHRNVLIAKVKNIGLKVSLEKTFKDGRVIFLPGDFIAFPESVRHQVEALVIQNGFAVKTVDHSC
ncbi:hypothetical protein [Desulfosarcina variabilis]|uniref:hypothetical protein n=1 Tax=Desulfosarcina variabilis TaxID=2300 RepID=UPI003AFA8114